MMYDDQREAPQFADTFDVKASLRSITTAAKLEKRLVLLTCLATLVLVTLYIYIWPPVYEAQSTVVAERDYDYARDNFYTGWDVFRKDEARTEVELMTTEPVLFDVVQKEHLTYDDVYHPFLSEVSYLWEKSWPGRAYHAVKRWVLPPDKDAPTQAQLDMARTVVDMRAGISVDPVAESNVAKINVKGPSRRVADIANSLMTVYMDHRLKSHEQEARSSYDSLQVAVRKAADEVNELSARRVAYAQQHHLSFDLQKENLEVTKLADLESEITVSRSKLASLDASLHEVEQQLQQEPETRTTETVFELNAVRESMKQKRVELMASLIAARDRYREDSPEVQEIVTDLAKLDALIAQSSEKVEKVKTEGLNSVHEQLITSRNSLTMDREGTHAGQLVMEARASELRTRLAEVPSMLSTLNNMDRDLAAASETYKQLLVKESQAELSLATAQATMPSIRIAENASRPNEKSWPKLKYLYPLGALAGLLFGTLVAVIKTYASGRIHREHVEGGRRAMPMYGSIGVVAGSRSPLTVIVREKEAGSSSASVGSD